MIQNGMLGLLQHTAKVRERDSQISNHDKATYRLIGICEFAFTHFGNVRTYAIRDGKTL
jgi:hypothetical protein